MAFSRRKPSVGRSTHSGAPSLGGAAWDVELNGGEGAPEHGNAPECGLERRSLVSGLVQCPHHPVHQLCPLHPVLMLPLRGRPDRARIVELFHNESVGVLVHQRLVEVPHDERRRQHRLLQQTAAFSSKLEYR